MSCNAANVRRRVKNLTQEDLLKKRAIDRENQRYSRAKTKTYIQGLEKRIAELTYQLRDAQAAINKCTCQCELVARVQSDDPSPGPEIEPLRDHATIKDLVQPIFPTSEPFIHEPLPRDEFMPDFLRLRMDFGTGFTINSNGSDPTDMNLWDLSMTGPDDMSAFLDSSTPNFMPLDVDNHDIAIGDDDHEVWQQMPQHISPACKLDEVIAETITSWRARAQQQGHQEAELTEPVFPNISSLLNPSPEEGQPASTTKDQEVRLPPLSRIVAAQVGRSSISRILERIAFMYNLSHMIRWLVCRSQESYCAMPAYLRPTLLQRTVAHPPWVDLIVWPQARDDIIRDMDWTRFEELRWLHGPRISINWRFGLSEAVLRSPDGLRMLLNPAFESHLHKLENWTTEKEVGDVFPFLKPFCR
ncbi:hypothetical protein F5X68DRAFT_273267 [Plectosphaerella plurivora]|uniref:BZIP domain-containing protein n=1 Tax=Plectosphaerella plurivora TaxID=936078 RepID=A0A9P8VHU7_9PEZI|nr:hypothetical protein F5X68DRAFT_273267 [Plectosphaerella plurivora]